MIIEPSGVGKLSDVIKAVREVSGRLDVQQNSAVTIVDASKCKMYMKNFGEFFNNQIEHAKTIVLSRTDVTDEAKVRKCVEMIREHNESAAIITTPCSQLSGSQLLEIMEKQDTMEMNLMKEIKNHDYGHHQKDGGGCGWPILMSITRKMGADAVVMTMSITRRRAVAAIIIIMTMTTTIIIMPRRCSAAGVWR